MAGTPLSRESAPVGAGPSASRRAPVVRARESPWQDPEAFEAGYPEQLARASKIPGVRRIESAKVWPKEDGSPTPAYRLMDLYFADYDAASAAVTTAEAGALFPSIFGLATGGVRIVFADVEQS